MPPGPNRWKERSRTFEGVAQAMGEQWGNRQLPPCEEQLSRLSPDPFHHLVDQVRLTITCIQDRGATAGVIALVAHDLRLRPICQ